MSFAWRTGQTMTDEELDALWELQECPPKREPGEIFWCVMLFIFFGIDLLGVGYLTYRIVSWLTALIWKVL
jgi:hypothetical protein